MAKRVRPRKSKDVPLTQSMLYEFRGEVMSRFLSLDHKFGSVDKRFDSVDAKFDSVDKRFDSVDAKFDSVDKRFDSVDAKFDSVDKRFDSVDAKFDSVDKRFDSVDAKFDMFGAQLREFRNEMMSQFQDLRSDFKKVQAEVSRNGMLIEEQNARNVFVLDGYTNLYDRVAKLEREK